MLQVQNIQALLLANPIFIDTIAITLSKGPYVPMGYTSDIFSLHIQQLQDW